MNAVTRAGLPLPRGEREARMAWSRISEPERSQAAVALIDEYGAEEAFARVAAGRVEGADRLQPRLAALDLERDLHVLVRIGARVLIPGDDEWPSGLDDLAVPPHCLWVRGPLHAGEACQRSVAVVGARSATSYGETTASDLAAGLCDRGFTVVSGAAFGIDAAAPGARSPSTARRLLSWPGSGTAVPGGAPTADRPDRRGRSGGLRGSARQRPDEAPLPQQEPHHRHCDPGHPRRRGRASVRLAQHREPGPATPPRGRSGARSRHVHGLGRVPRVHPRPRRHPRDRCRRGGRGRRPARTRPGPREAGSGEAGDDLDDAEAMVLAALPVRRPASVATLVLQTTLGDRELVACLGRLEVRRLAQRDGQGWRKTTARRAGFGGGA